MMFFHVPVENMTMPAFLLKMLTEKQHDAEEKLSMLQLKVFFIILTSF